MIFKYEHNDSRGNEPDLYDCQITSILTDAGLDDAYYAGEVSKGVAHFVAENRNGEWVERTDLGRMASTAFAALGSSSYSERLIACCSGGARFWSCAAAEDGAVVLLDLERFFDRNEACMELVVVPALQRMLMAFLNVWDSVNGRGMLVLKNSRVVAARLSGRKGPARKHTDAVIKEMSNACRQKFLLLKKKRKWDDVPLIWNADL